DSEIEEQRSYPIRPQSEVLSHGQHGQRHPPDQHGEDDPPHHPRLVPLDQAERPLPPAGRATVEELSLSTSHFLHMYYLDKKTLLAKEHDEQTQEPEHDHQESKHHRK